LVSLAGVGRREEQRHTEQQQRWLVDRIGVRIGGKFTGRLARWLLG
jgi:hypothetical protein